MFKPLKALSLMGATVLRGLQQRGATPAYRNHATALSDDTGVYLKVGVAALILLVGGLGGWAANVTLAGAVLAHGTVVVERNVKKVQHLTGGIVGEIRVRDGDTVKAGDVLIRLDETIARANLGVITKQLDELTIRRARLKAERDSAASVEAPSALAARLGEPELAEILASERTLFESRKAARTGQKAQLRERIAQLKEEIGGLAAQQQAKAKELDLVKVELAAQESLWAKNLISISKHTATRREATRLDGERGQLIAAAAQAKGKIAEIELQIIQLDQDLKTEVIRDMREIQAKEAELNERRVAAEDQLKRVEIRAPQAGVVHQLVAHTIDGVIAPGEPIMLIVPGDDTLVIEAKVAPHDIDQVKLGQTAYLRFAAFNQATTPEVMGIVARVSADLVRETQTNLAYYVARIALPDEALKGLGDLKLLPGMPVEVQIRTSDRTALSYLVKPLGDQIARAFKER